MPSSSSSKEMATPHVSPKCPSPITHTSHRMVTRGKQGIFKPIQKLNQHVDATSLVPKNYLKAFQDPNWLNAMTNEYIMLISNQTWVLVPRPLAANIVNCIWFFKRKLDCDETFSPVVKPATIHTILSIFVTYKCPIRQLDIKNAFLHGHLQELVYMHQPSGFRDPSRPDYVCLLQCSLYGLKQAPRA